MISSRQGARYMGILRSVTKTSSSVEVGSLQMSTDDNVDITLDPIRVHLTSPCNWKVFYEHEGEMPTYVQIEISL